MSAKCSVCGPGRVLPCSRCGSALNHAHLTVRGRDGRARSDAVLCSTCQRGVRVGRLTLAEALRDVEQTETQVTADEPAGRRSEPLRRVEGASS